MRRTPHAATFFFVVSGLARLVAFLLAFSLVPGGAEIVENAAHLVVAGHTAHALDDADHASHGAEHGCSGVVHVCPCHSSTCFVVSEGVAAGSDRVPSSSPYGVGLSMTTPPSGHSFGVYRPPSA